MPLRDRFKTRKSIKALPTVEEMRHKRFMQAQTRRAAARNDLIWKLRTETYRVDSITGFFQGSYMKGGATILVCGSTRARIRYERTNGAIPERWVKVAYSDPR